ncbi:hypothetical protein MEG1DRAFT_04457 [Photorhabdus temperata subsp. temperata Meg1]|uniref:Filamentous hemagglutinin n=1 Tax=Photorhabdus temperata subsp. temperata Meg1 TaxID=1393735 RepID=A0A081RQJ4_PHOTE|nr:hypothetical protein MEG1DRAFT_04457 [Photorhabdus temperata subsp. temperata Meg1]
MTTENQNDLRLLYNSLPAWEKGALIAKETVESAGIGGAIGSKVSVASIVGKNKGQQFSHDYTLNKNGQMIGANGVQVPSKTIWKGVGKERIDVENPNPGQRAGQLHYQDNQGNKYYYDSISNTFPDAPKKVNELLKDSSFKNAIDKGMKQYLGEK